MTRIQYRAALPPPAPTLAVVAGGSITAAKAGTWYFWLQSRCRGGYTTLSDAASISLSAGNQLQVTLPSTIRTPAADVQEVYILAALTNAPLTACVIATYPGYGTGGALATLPATVTLSRDAHLDLLKAVVNEAGLPTGSDRTNGMRRYVDSLGLFRSWNAELGLWETCRPQSFNTYVSSTLSTNGCDRDLKDITDQSIILYPSYSAEGGESPAIDFWLVNDADVAIPRGERIRMAVATDLFDILSDDFKGLLNLEFLGYSQLSTGTLDTSIEGAGSGKFPYQGDEKTNLKLNADLPSGWAYTLRVTGAFSDYQLDNGFPQGAILKYYPRFATNASVYNPAGDVFGNLIVPDGGKRRILPGTGLSAIAADGKGTIASYNWDKGVQSVPLLAADTAGQKIAVSNTGLCFPVSTVPTSTAALRATIGTIDGVGSATAWQGSVALSAASLLQVTVTHPTTIRTDYPDLIAGTASTLNATSLYVYVRPVGGGTIREFKVNLVGGTSEVVLVGGLLNAPPSVLPTVAADFGLFTPGAYVLATTTGTSVFTTDTYEVAIAYGYEDVVTTIDNNDDLEIGGTASQLFGVSKAWGRAVVATDINAAIKAIPETEVWDLQTRRISDSLRSRIYYDASSTLAESLSPIDPLDRVWLPNWRTSGQPGRWRVDVGARLSISSSYKGAWSSVTSYVKDDLVFYDGQTWVALQGSLNQIPASGSIYWGVLAGVPQAQTLGLILALG